MSVRTHRKSGLTIALAIVLGGSSPSFAQGLTTPSSATDVTFSPNVSGPATYGLVHHTSYVVNAADFVGFNSTETLTTNAGGSRYFTSGVSALAPVLLPNGALLTHIELQACDTSAIHEISVGLFSSTINAGTEMVALVGSLGTGVAFAGGCGLFTVSVPPATVDNTARSYFLTLGTTTNTSAVRIQAVRLSYKLQVSPAPGTATFTDVPLGHPQRQFIEALAASGITGGCGGGNYCPDAPLTRGQMAVFLAAALGLHFPN